MNHGANERQFIRAFSTKYLRIKLGEIGYTDRAAGPVSTAEWLLREVPNPGSGATYISGALFEYLAGDGNTSAALQPTR